MFYTPGSTSTDVRAYQEQQDRLFQAEADEMRRERFTPQPAHTAVPRPKLFEVRDEGTCIPVLAVLLDAGGHPLERRILARAGFRDGKHVLLTSLNNSRSSHDPFGHGSAGRTLREAHRHIEANWDKLTSGDVIDVQFILGETAAAKASELDAAAVAAAPPYRFPMVYCSSCGCGFGPGNEGFSHCESHAGLTAID